MALNLTKSFFITIVVLGAFLYLMGKLYNINFVYPYQEDKGINIGLILLIVITVLTLTGISIAYNVLPSTKDIMPPIGNKGERGLRGSSGIKAQCGIKCSDSMCYRKVIDHISKVYNIYCKVHNKPMLGKGRYINNKFIKIKVKEICGSQVFADLIKKMGAHKLNSHGKPLNESKCNINSHDEPLKINKTCDEKSHGEPLKSHGKSLIINVIQKCDINSHGEQLNESKCDKDSHGKLLKINKIPKCNINSNCGAYDYIFQKWTEWILIILKYRNGKLFLDSENLNDNDFNNMIHNDDLEIHNTGITREWIFNISEDNYSIDDVLDPPGDENEKREINDKFKQSNFYKFYTYRGVPDAYNNKETNGKSDSDRKLNMNSPFDEIKMYDTWYWGANPLSTPKLVDKCIYETEENGDTNTESNNTTGKLKFKLTNDYDHIWSSDKARQVLASDYCYAADDSEDQCKDTYIPFKNKGEKPIDVYRPKPFYDNHEDDLEFKSYKPLHDIMVPKEDNVKEDNVDLKKPKDKNEDCYPRLQQSTYNSYPNKYTDNGPRNMSLLVSGDVKHPTSYDEVYVSKRTEGFNANKKSYSFWRPVAPDGYTCLGDVIDTNPYGNVPNKNSVVCIPSKCVVKIPNPKTSGDIKSIWNTEEPESEKIISDATPFEIDLTKNGSSLDTDHPQDKGDVPFKGVINTRMPNKPFDENKRKNNDKMSAYLNKYNSFRGADGMFYTIKKQCIYDEQANLVKKDTTNIIKQDKNHIKYSILDIYNK